MKRYLKYICVCILTMLAVSCQQDEPLDMNEKVTVSYSVRMPARDASRVAIDGSKVNTLIVEVFEKEGDAWRSAFRRAGIPVTDGNAGVDIPLLKHRSYEVVFWAQNDEVTAYSTEDLSHIQVNYTDYSSGFTAVEGLDAFYFVDTVEDLKSTSKGNVELKRPFVYLNFDNKTQNTPKKTILTIQDVCTSFYPLTGEAKHNSSDQTFSFTGTEADGTIAACLLFTSEDTEVTINGELKIDNGFSTITKPISILVEDANHRYNAEGEFVSAIHWKNKTELPSYDETNNRYVIQNEAQLAWWMNPITEELNEGATEIFIEKDLDMQNVPMDPLKLLTGFTLNGNYKTISNLKLSGGLLGNATNLEVQNLTISQAEVVAASGHVGVLANTLTGRSTFTGVTITNSSATTSSGAAGGMVGYITNKEGETLEVIFSGCTAIDNEVSGSLTSGVYVGRFRGYNNAETLTFSADCDDESSATFGSNAKVPYYTTANAACWFTSEQTTTFNKYSGWLGDEEYYRGTINYGGERYIPKWDGTTKAPNLLTEGATKLIYSAFDFAFLQGNSYGSDNPVTIMEDIDLGGYSYTPIKKLSTLNGEYNSIYNLKIEVEKKLYHASLIEKTSGTTVHENITFVNPSIKHTHDPNSTGGDAYAAVLCSYNDEGNYTLTNVHIEGGNIYAVNKIGGILGYVATNNITATNCTVRGLTIENYEVLIKDPIFQIHEYVIGFYPHGEVGGLFGFVASNAKIENCHVSESTFKCVGVKEMLWFNDSKIPGRHVNHFIGDIRTTKGQKIEIKDCTATNNEYLEQEYSNKESESKSTNFSWYYVLKENANSSKGNLMSSCTYTYNEVNPEVALVGCCYYIYCEIYALFGSMYKKLADTKGELWIDGVQKF